MSLGFTIGLAIAGICLICCEVFIPGGIVGLIGCVLLIVGVIAGFAQSAKLGFGMLVGSIVLGFSGFWLWLKFFPRSPMGKRLMLGNTAKEWRGFDTHQQDLVGKIGVAHTALRPAGTAIIDGKRVNVVTRGELLEPKQRVKVIQVEGNRIVVTATAEEAPIVEKPLAADGAPERLKPLEPNTEPETKDE